jgi:hypothetical protein
MAAKIATLCDAVVDFLNAGSFSQSFTATRSNAPTQQLEDTTDILVTVFPGDYFVESESRDTWRRTYSVFVAVQKMVADQTEQDEMLELVEEIEESLEGESMADYPMSNLAGTSGSRSPIDLDQIRVANQFVSVLEVNYLG